MQHSLDGKTFVWISWDAAGIFTAATRKMLTEQIVDNATQLQLIRAASLDDLPTLMQRQVTGLLTFVVQHESEVPAACRALWRVRGRLAQPICACFVSPDLIDTIAVLLEAGAQVVTSRLDVWQRALPPIIAKAPISTHGIHPLTAGLISRLPWKEQA